jgi:hypothetical protein
MRRHPIFQELDSALDGLVNSEPIELAGSWLPATHRTYERATQLGSGEGPFREIVDWRWRGQLSSAAPIVAVAFLVTSGECAWSKSSPPQPQLEVDFSFHVYAEYQPDRATFAARVTNAVLSAPVAWKNGPAATCELAAAALRTARVETVLQTQEATFALLLLPADVVKTGRHRLWRVRDSVASALPANSRELLTRRRSGSFR